MNTVLKTNSFDQTPLYIHHWPAQSIVPQKIVVIIHGMMEHGKRYSHFADYLSQHNITVYAYDQRGHGRTSPTKEKLGQLHGNWNTLIKDGIHVLQTVAAKHPQIPLILLGHSMGSYVAQHLATQVGHKLNGLILSGTSFEKQIITSCGAFMARTLGNLLGDTKKAHIIHKIIFSPLNKQFQPISTPFDWLTRDKECVTAYQNDPYCGFICSYNFFKTLFEGLHDLYAPSTLAKIPTELPMLVLNGMKDPLSKNGKTVKELIALYQELNKQQITHKAYKNARHEILNERHKEIVYQDILDWLDDITHSKKRIPV